MTRIQLIKSRPACGSAFSFDFLLQIVKQIHIEEVLDGDVEAVTDFLNGGNRGAAVAVVDDVIQGGLGHAAENGQLVDGDVSLVAQVEDALADGCSNCHGFYLLSICIRGRVTVGNGKD